MAATIIDGKQFAADLRADITKEVTRLKDEHQLTPGLAVILAGEDPASAVYVRNKARFTAESGMNSYEHRLPADVSENELLSLVQRLNNDDAVHGILVQLPLPSHIDSALVINSINPDKDVDGFHIHNVGRLSIGLPSLVPCTPLGVILMLKHYLGPLVGKSALVIGRSNIVGKPMSQLLMRERATVTVAHSKTTNLPELVSQSDIVIAAVGRPEMVLGDWIQPGAAVIDVGINRVDAPERGEGKTRITGDVEYQSAHKVAGYITPVPGGVGPMTIACLLRNSVTACCAIHAIESQYNN